MLALLKDSVVPSYPLCPELVSLLKKRKELVFLFEHVCEMGTERGSIQCVCL